MWRAALIVFGIFLAFTALADDKLVGAVEPLGRTPSNLAVERVTLKAIPVAVGNVQGRLAAAATELPKAIDALTVKLKEKNIEIVGPPLAQFNAASEENYSADIMLPVIAPLEEQISGLRFGLSPAGKALRVTHKGPLASIEDSYFEIQTFVEDQGLEVSEVTIERYMTDPAKTAEKDMLTEIYVPLK